ncbi:MAG: hypothetical protein ACT4UP_08670 [Gammaproteobacteria bacterium]
MRIPSSIHALIAAAAAIAPAVAACEDPKGTGHFNMRGEAVLEYDLAGEEQIVDRKAGVTLTVRPGMPKGEFLNSAAALGASVTVITDDEIRFGDSTVLIFVDGKLKRIRP